MIMLVRQTLHQQLEDSAITYIDAPGAFVLNALEMRLFLEQAYH